MKNDPASTPATWRLIRTPPVGGAWNMALDEALLESAGRGEAPALRLYAWDPPCLSLGYAQPISDADLEALSALGWDLVRRPTGGRAILHTDELTYSVTGPQEDPRLAGSVLESYRRLSQALLEALHRLGIQAQALPDPIHTAPEAAGQPAPAGSQAVCFEIPSNYEITVDGRKLIGSAQARRKEGVLQHGSFPLSGDLSRITRALVFDSPQRRQRAAARLVERAATAEDVLGTPLPWETAAQAFTAAFAEILNLNLQPTEPSEQEMTRAAELVALKYNHPAWTGRV